MKILDRLPIFDEPALIHVHGNVYQVWKNQAIIWVSFAETLLPFPAILDTGHSHNLSIARRHMKLWGRSDAKQIGHARIAGHLIPRYASELFVHRNLPGTPQLSGMHRLEIWMAASPWFRTNCRLLHGYLSWVSKPYVLTSSGS